MYARPLCAAFGPAVAAASAAGDAPHSPPHDLSHRLRRGAARVAAREQTAAEERAFQRAIAMHAAAAEARGFADRIEPGDDPAVLAEHPRVEIGLKAAQRLAGEDVE